MLKLETFEKLTHVIEQLITSEGENLLSIILVGSEARRDSDEYSDYDLVCVYETLRNPLFHEGTHLIKEKVFGFRNIPISFLEKKAFTQVQKHAYKHSKILYDSQGKLQELLKRKCVFEKKERLNLFCNYLVKLSYTYDVTNNYKNCWNSCDELKKSIARRRKIYTDVEKLHFLKYSIYLEFLVKKEFIPPDKVLFSSWSDKISPKIVELKKLYESFDDPELFAKESSYIIQSIIEEFEKEEPLPEDIYQYRIKVTRQYD